MASGVVVKLLKTAATNIPWARLVQNAPAVVDLVEKVKERMSAAGHDIHLELQTLREENLRIANHLLQTSAELEQLKKTLEVVAARQKVMMVVTAVSLLTAVAALVAWLS